MICGTRYCEGDETCYRCKINLEALRELEQHGSDVAKLMLCCSEMATLVVGEEKREIACHKALLAYFSKFFDSALYGGFVETETARVNLPDEEFDDVQDFVTWIYTGQVLWERGDFGYSKGAKTDSYEKDGETKPIEIANEKLWVFGDKFNVPRYANLTMSYLIDFYRVNFYGVKATEYVFASTLPGSKLRQLFKDLIRSEGPLSEIRHSVFGHEEWVLLLAKGGDLIKECIKDGFSQLLEEEEDKPWAEENRVTYMTDDARVGPEEWMTSRNKSMRNGTVRKRYL